MSSLVGLEVEGLGSCWIYVFFFFFFLDICLKCKILFGLEVHI